MVAGISTDVMKRCVGDEKQANLCCSLLCEGRSVDLKFDTPHERAAWSDLLGVLVGE